MYHTFRRGASPIIPICAVLAIIVSVGCISGCRSSNFDAKLASSTTSTTAPTLTWAAPTTYTDGSALLDLKEYRIYFSTSPDPYATGHYYAVPAPATSVKIKDAISSGTGTYYFVVTAVDSTNRESSPSNEVSKHVD